MWSQGVLYSLRRGGANGVWESPRSVDPRVCGRVLDVWSPGCVREFTACGSQWVWEIPRCAWPRLPKFEHESLTWTRQPASKDNICRTLGPIYRNCSHCWSWCCWSSQQRLWIGTPLHLLFSRLNTIRFIPSSDTEISLMWSPFQKQWWVHMRSRGVYGGQGCYTIPWRCLSIIESSALM